MTIARIRALSSALLLVLALLAFVAAGISAANNPASFTAFQGDTTPLSLDWTP